MPEDSGVPRDYVLGHSRDELQRLISQAGYFGDLTADLFERAGLASGMRVLDIGCGVGDVSFLAADFVGPTGSVVGIDRSPEAVAVATARAAAADLPNVHFLSADLGEVMLEAPVDALIGRLVLMYFPDPVRILRHLLTQVLSGGIVALHEFDMDGMKTSPCVPLVDSAVARIRETFDRSGADPRIGLRLAHILDEAGVAGPQMLMTARVERAKDARAFEQITLVTRTLLPVMERTGVATAAEVDVDTLAGRLREEATRVDATIVAPPLVGAWARKP